MPQTFTGLQEKPFELQIWIVITAIGALRSLKAVAQDLINAGSAIGLMIDTSILVTFVAVCLLIYREKIRGVPVIVAMVLLALLTVSFIRLGGVRGTSEYNLMALSILFAFVYRGQALILILALYFVSILVASIDLRVDGWMTRHLFNKPSTGLDAYFTTLLTLLAIFTYFKYALVKESTRIVELRGTLGEHISTIKRQHLELEGQQQLLHDINARLNDEISRHTREIVTRDKAIQDFIWLSTETLHIPLQRITSIARDLPEGNYMESQLKEQVAELCLVIYSLKEELKQHERKDQTQ